MVTAKCIENKMKINKVVANRIECHRMTKRQQSMKSTAIENNVGRDNSEQNQFINVITSSE